MSITGEVLEERMDEFPLEVLGHFVLGANHVFETVVYRAWNSQEMRQKLRRRALSTIIIDGDVNHDRPCCDTATLAAAYLERLGLNPRQIILTNKGDIEEYRDGKCQGVHMDSGVELNYQGTIYGMDIGSGDLTFFKLDKAKGNDGQDAYFTTRFEPHSQTWPRTDVLLLAGDVILKNPDTPILEFLSSPHNLVKVPFGLTLKDYHTFQTVTGEESALDTNLRYDRAGCQKFTQDWTADFNDYTSRRAQRENARDFPKLVPIRYR